MSETGELVRGAWSGAAKARAAMRANRSRSSRVRRKGVELLCSFPQAVPPAVVALKLPSHGEPPAYFRIQQHDKGWRLVLAGNALGTADNRIADDGVDFATEEDAREAFQQLQANLLGRRSRRRYALGVLVIGMVGWLLLGGGGAPQRHEAAAGQAMRPINGMSAPMPSLERQTLPLPSAPVGLPEASRQVPVAPPIAMPSAEQSEAPSAADPFGLKFGR